MDSVHNTTKFCTVCGKARDTAKIQSVNHSPDYPKTEGTQPVENKKNYTVIGLVGVIGVLIVVIGYLLFKLPQNEEVAEIPEKIPETVSATKETPKEEVQPQPKEEIKSQPIPLGKNWIKDINGVYLWNPQPTEGESITWTGGYIQDGDYRYADGTGITTWYLNGQVIQVDEGTFRHGQRHGRFTHKFSGGRIEYSNWDNGLEIEEPTPKISDVDIAKQTFIKYHRAITNKNYREAYNILSYSQQQRMGSFENYVSGFANTISSEVTNLTLVSQETNSYTFEYTLTARDHYQGGRIKVQIFKGHVIMAEDNGNWYVQYAQSNKISERIE